ncbi:MAG: helix-turn-helix domain-containing protein [Candidatus Thiodiazotropha endolucinida]|nr:helix-turn-helix domain-containing protein [Candidatus Thiodiazotropha taylori]MCW4349689.1 helix-turn-helix domain-containing protein [Candidatus Thiodiazotropha endolucinida]
MAAAGGCKVETVRYYEKIGLMPEPPRTEGGHRLYSLDLLKRLTFIRRSRELGFPIEQIRVLLRFVDEPGHTCDEVKGMATLQARAVQEKIDDLKRLQKALNDMAARCKGKGYALEDCPIIDALFDETRDRQG